MKALSPKDVFAKKKPIPDEIIGIVNGLLVENQTQERGIRIFQDEILQRIFSEPGIERAKVFKNGWLDIEGHYKKSGWKVKYDSPAYGEDFKAYFYFEPSRLF